MRHGHTADARRRGDTTAKTGGTPRPLQGAPGVASHPGKGTPAEISSDGLVTAIEAQSGAAVAAIRAAGSVSWGTKGTDHARALRQAEAAARLTAASADLLARDLARRASLAEGRPHLTRMPAGWGGCFRAGPRVGQDGRAARQAPPRARRCRTRGGGGGRRRWSGGDRTPGKQRRDDSWTRPPAAAENPGNRPRESELGDHARSGRRNRRG
jgi:hypothetical protein